MSYSAEIQTKLDRVRALMDAHHVGALWLRRVDNVAWLTGGIDVAVNTADAVGVASLVITADTCAMWTNTIEAPRLQAEDRVEERGIELHVTPWETPQAIPIGNTLGADFGMADAVDLSGEITKLRARLLLVEQDRFRALGTSCAEAMQHAIRQVQPGNTEGEIAAVLAAETRRRHTTPIVVLVAVDERVYNVRHPLPTDKIMKKYAMLVLCGRREGLVCSVTRLVHFGPLPDDLRRRMDAAAEVDAAMIAASKPGATLEEIFQITQEAYARVGFEGEWKLHHQGGIAGYAARELIAVPGEKTALEPGMVCAWNPSISGTKSEDTILITETDAPEILTAMDDWPARPIEVDGLTLKRPLIMEAYMTPK